MTLREAVIEAIRVDWTKTDRAQARGIEIGGMVWAFVFFFGLIIFGGAIEILVMDSAVDPMIAFANSMDQSSTQSETGLNWFEDWRNAFTLIVMVIAAAFLIGMAAFYSQRRY